MLLDPTLCVVASGEKKAHVGEEAYTYDPYHYRVLAVALPVEVEITRASPEAPLLAIALDLDLATLTEVVLEFEDMAPPSNASRPSRGIYTSGLDHELRAAVSRLLRSVHDPRRREVLAPMAVREILFHLVSGEYGDTLRSIALRDGKSQRISRALRFIQAHYAESLDVPTIARAAYMSTSALHHDFKAVTSTSPMQYLKQLRLHEARRIMLQEDKTAAGAAREVGYRSPSQFNREYRRLFGAPPRADVRSLQEAAYPA
jgi:AraC-like DNA-binding protein